MAGPASGHQRLAGNAHRRDRRLQHPGEQTAPARVRRGHYVPAASQKRTGRQSAVITAHATPGRRKSGVRLGNWCRPPPPDDHAHAVHLAQPDRPRADPPADGLTVGGDRRRIVADVIAEIEAGENAAADPAPPRRDRLPPAGAGQSGTIGSRLFDIAASSSSSSASSP